MSFITVLGKLGRIAVGLEPIAAKIGEVAFPQFGPEIGLFDNWLQHTLGSMAKAEVASPNGGGPAKAAQTVDAFGTSDAIATIQELLATQKKLLTYDGAALQKAITDQTTAFNSWAQFKNTFKIVDKP